MTKRRKQAIILLALSGPMMWFGFTNFMAGGISSTALAIGIAIASVFGGFAAISGLTMLITKNSLGILNPDDKGRGEDLLASQTSEDSPIPEDLQQDLQQDLVIQNEMKRAYQDSVAQAQKEIINKKVKPMAKTKEFELADAVEEIRALGELIVQKEERIKKDTLAVKTATEKRAVLKDNLAKDKTVKELLAVLQESNAI